MTVPPVLPPGLHGLRFALGTLSIVPVRVRRVDRDVARAAMLWAPAVGALIGVLQAAVLLTVRELTGAALPAAALAAAAGAVLTRGLHLDGLADVADGLGSGRPAEGALEIMKRSDIGPFGVVSLVLTLLVQVTALATATEHGHGVSAIVVAAVTGRLVLPWACRRGVPAARPDGLGAAVAGSVPAAAAAAVTLTVAAAVVAGSVAAGHGARAVALAAAVAAGLAVAELFRLHLRRRLGGVTGDVLGALVETAATAALLVAATA